MPHRVIKTVWDYCAYSKKFFAFIIILIFISSLIQNEFHRNLHMYEWLAFQVISTIVVAGYGMVITRDRINHGVRLPKIVIKDILVLGVKSFIVFEVYLFVQGCVLDLICSPLDFPEFELEDMLINFQQTLHTMQTHNPLHTAIYIIVGAILFYITAFFLEIALAKLADTNSLKEAFNIVSIKRSIDVIGWRHYAKEYTMIILAIVILSYLDNFTVFIPVVDGILGLILGLLIFATQFMGIGAVYRNIKDTERKKINVEYG